jgi:type II secretory pathway pseudopilin PulG
VKKGFTLVELLVIVAIVVIIGGVVLVNLSGRRVDTDVITATQQIATLLRQAQSDSMAGEGGAVWGVHFANSTGTPPFYALFRGSYATGTVTGRYLLPLSVAYRTSTLASGATLDVIFSQASGAASASTSIGLYMPKENTAFSSTISVASTGAVSY